MNAFRPLLFATLVACGAPQNAPVPEPDDMQEHAVEPSDAEPAAEEHHRHHAHAETADISDHGERAHAVGEHGDHHHGFENPAEWASRWEGPQRDAWQDPGQVIDWMNIEPGHRAVDIGAGTGYFLPHLSDAVGDEGHVFCADVEPAMVEYLTARIAENEVNNASAHLAAFDDPGLEPGTIDRVLLVNTWHHIEGRLDYAAVLRDSLAPGGTVTIVEFNSTAQPGPPAEMRMTPDEVMAEFDAAGFETELLGDLERQYVVRATPVAE